MAFPQTAAPTETTVSPASTSHNIAMPPSVDAGDLLLVFIGFVAATDPGAGTPSGWTQLWSSADSSGGSIIRGAGYAKFADGSEDGATVDFTSTGASTAAAQCYRVTAWHGALSGVEDGTPVVQLNTTAPNPPSLTASWGALDNLWFAVTALEANSAFTGYPTNYTNGIATSGSDPTVASCRRELAAATDDPAAFTCSVGDETISNTIVVRGTAPAGHPAMRRRSGVPHMRPGARGLW